MAQDAVGEWGFLAWVIWPVALLVVYIRSPKMPDSMLESLEKEGIGDTEISALEQAYVRRLKGRQIKAAWIGTGLSFATVVIVMIIVPQAFLGGF